MVLSQYGVRQSPGFVHLATGPLTSDRLETFSPGVLLECSELVHVACMHYGQRETTEEGALASRAYLRRMQQISADIAS
ncbi:MAG: hypothetical protein MUE41_08530, partial [Gemmatimonadaceae bacterium]|nr:hypothetical protein [Gemmatimonadaceae bacterium]